MNKGFIFNHNLCVACGACSAGCMLENKWSFRPRTIFTLNAPLVPALPVINLSLACNHCKNAVCMDGCPTAAYYREPVSGAIVIDDSKCIGCRYCQWNCPYDAPKYIYSDEVIGKCNLCYKRLEEELIPACASACPTGALEYGKLNEQEREASISWFPEKNLDPAVRFTGIKAPFTRIIPEDSFDKVPVDSEEDPQDAPEWSLVAFSFLTTLSVAQMMASFLGGHFPEKIFAVLIIAMAGLSSLFHLGKKKRAWRAVVNIRSSPLSREIVLFILYSTLTGTAVLLQLPVLLILSAITGLILLLAIDAVYIFSDRQKSVFFHSGQTFISGLLIASFLSGRIFPFVFIAILSLSASFLNKRLTKEDNLLKVTRFLRIALLLITGIAFITGKSSNDMAVSILFLTGELLGRILFYIDFKPLNIKRVIK